MKWGFFEFLKKNNKWATCSLILSILLILPILSVPAFGPIDDHRLLNLNDYSFFELIREKYSEMIANKRFVPFGIVDQYLISKISSSPVFFYSTLFTLALLGLITIYAVAKNTGSRKIGYIFIPFILLSVTFTDNFYRLAPAEKYLFLFIPLFIFYFIKYLETEKLKLIPLIILFAVLGIFSKEIIFSLFGSFAAFYILLSYSGYDIPKVKPRNTQLINLGILTSTFGFLAIYYFFVYKKGDTNTAGFGNIYDILNQARFILALKLYVSYMFKVPLVTIFVPIALFLRIIFNKEIIKHFQIKNLSQRIPFYDSLLISSLIYTLFVCITGQGNFGRYLLPALLFSFFPTIEYFNVFFSSVKNKLFKIVSILLVSYSLLNSSIRGVEWGLLFKLYAYSFTNSLELINSTIPEKGSLNIYLADVDPFDGAEIYMSYGWFLKKQLHIPSRKFDLNAINYKEREFSKDWFTHDPMNIDFDFVNYSALQTSRFREPTKGDLIIISSTNIHKNKTLEELQTKGIDFINTNYKTNKTIFFPNPLSISVLLQRKPLFKKFTIYDDIYMVVQ